MKRITHYLTAGLVVAAVSLIAVACGSGSTSAADTLTQAAVQKMIDTAISAAVDPLKTQLAADEATIKTLEASRPAVFIRSPNSTTARRTESVDGCAALPAPLTLTGRPTTSDPIADDTKSGISGTSYYVTISGAPTASDCADVQTIPAAVTVYFSDALCHDVEGAVGMSSDAINQGFVFHMHLNGIDSGQYWYLPAKSTPVSMSYQSLTTSSDGVHVTCLATFGTENHSGTVTAYPILANDPRITDIPSAPIQGPLPVTQ